ncbi:MAG: hypothetical protein J3K34DRAFT_526174 [Monoraphidium minutum]|nr:MAG: hypothetical protein J3K34DRAFT_526174 [Monoraphidium minutum]
MCDPAEGCKVVLRYSLHIMDQFALSTETALLRLSSAPAPPAPADKAPPAAPPRWLPPAAVRIALGRVGGFHRARAARQRAWDAHITAVVEAHAAAARARAGAEAAAAAAAAEAGSREQQRRRDRDQGRPPGDGIEEGWRLQQSCCSPLQTAGHAAP